MFLLEVPHYIKATYIRAKVPNSFSKRMKLLHTLIEHVMLKECRIQCNSEQSLDLKPLGPLYFKQFTYLIFFNISVIFNHTFSS